MNLVNFKYHFRRILAMLRFKGLRYTFNYLFYLGFYNTNFLRNLFLTKLYPLFIFYPHYIEIEVTTRCNLKCTMCEHTYWDEKPQDMSFENFKYIVDQFPKLKWIGLTGIGEGFLNKDFIKMLGYVKSKSIYSEIYDTFFFIDEKKSKELIEMGFDRLIMSIDAATKKTYEKIRVGSNFDKVIGNVKGVIQLKKELNAHYPEIMFHYIISKYNIEEMLPFIDLVDSLRANEDVAITFSAILHPFKEIKNMVVDIPKELVKNVEEKSKSKGIKLGWNKDVLEKLPISRCTEWTMPFFHVDGTVVSCCASNENNLRVYQHEHSLGNIFKKDFKMIWNGEKYRSLRDMIHEGKIPNICRNCIVYNINEDRSESSSH